MGKIHLRAICAAGVLLAGAVFASAQGTITEYPVPTPGSGPFGIISGPDGNLWFAEYSVNNIGRITTAGVVTEFPIPTGGSYPTGITSGPDGNLWFTEQLGNNIGRITTNGVITEFVVPTLTCYPNGITSGPDGNLWFTELRANKIGRITTSGMITEFGSSYFAFGITSGPDGNLWFTASPDVIGRLTTAGVITLFPVITRDSSPVQITSALDGNLWFTEFDGNNIGRITTAGVVTEFPIPTPNSEPEGITSGSDGKVWFTEYSGNKIGSLAPTVLQFVAVTPCRLVDTRNANGEFGGPPLQGGTARSFPLPQGSCNIPATAAGYSLNVTVVPPGSLGYLTIWPTGQDQPYVSTLNSYDGRVKANAAIVAAGYQGAVSVYVSDTTNVVLDIDGYFAPVSRRTATLAFYPLPPCRVADTRNPVGDLGGPYLMGGVPRAFPILEATSCNISNTAQAYSLNFTAVPHQPLGYLTVWPTGQAQPNVSTLNAPTGTVTANAAIVPAGNGGEVSTFAYNDTDLIIDIDGYFAPPVAGGLSLYPVVPCRVLDTRQGSGAFSGELTVDVLGSVCALPSQSQAYVFNATVVPMGSLDYLTLWPDGSTQPVASTLNAYDAAVTSNLAIVPAGTLGKIDAYAYGLTQLILDISSYFAQ